jgi:hypothetical protein
MNLKHILIILKQSTQAMYLLLQREEIANLKLDRKLLGFVHFKEDLGNKIK